MLASFPRTIVALKESLIETKLNYALRRILNKEIMTFEDIGPYQIWIRAERIGGVGDYLILWKWRMNFEF